MKMPAQGLSRAEVASALESIRSGDVGWRDGRMWAYVYAAGEDVEKVTKEAFASFLTENALDPTVFPSMLKLEMDVVGIIADHLNAPKGAVGSFTSGGTESIFLAMKSARDWARAHRPVRSVRPSTSAGSAIANRQHPSRGSSLMSMVRPSFSSNTVWDLSLAILSFTSALKCYAAQHHRRFTAPAPLVG